MRSYSLDLPVFFARFLGTSLHKIYYDDAKNVHQGIEIPVGFIFI